MRMMMVIFIRIINKLVLIILKFGSNKIVFVVRSMVLNRYMKVFRVLNRFWVFGGLYIWDC